MTLTLIDLYNTSRKSKFDHVGYAGGANNDASYKKPFQANIRDRGGLSWTGPRRVTAAAAAQDYCDYVNGLPPSQRPKRLKAAGHASRRNPRKLTDAEVALRKLQREALAESEGRQGYVYCVAEDPNSGGDYKYFRIEDTSVRVGGIAVKIGFSVEPRARVAELQTGNPRKLKLLGFFEGTLEDEADVHRRFHKDNVLQEWFRPSYELLSLFVNKEG